MLDRLLWVLAGCGAAALLVIARRLVPAIEGHGTHLQLGLPPCALLSSTGLPCPACGLTTSFAHMAQLQPFEAMAANAAGVPGFVLVVAVALASPVALWCGWRVDTVLRAAHVERIAVALGVMLCALWLFRLAAIALA